MKSKKYIIVIILGVIFSGCDLEEVWYDEVVPETFFKTEGDVLAALYRPFTHARWYLTGDRWEIQEFSSDQFTRATKGRHWYDGGTFERFLYHEWTPDEGKIWGAWRGTLQGVALALDVKKDLGQQDYAALALTEEDKAAHLAQLDALTAFFYLRGLDYFGGLPIFTSLDQEDVLRSTDQETFQHIEGLLQQAIIDLPVKVAGEPEEGAITRGAAAVMLARLYFNAEAYIGSEMFAEAAKISEDIIAGEYGNYTLDPDWKGPHKFDNHTSSGVIWSMPSEFNRLEYSWHFNNFYHYNTRVYFDVDMGSNNGTHLQPSREPDGSLYSEDFRLGSPFEKFEDTDLRKQPYEYLGSGNYKGMFLVGPQISPINGAEVIGNEEYSGELLEFVDMVGRFSEVGTNYSSVGDLPSSVSEGEENTGVRLVKVPVPSNQDQNLRWGADHPVLRLAEVYYMLAESKLRLGEPGAADLINTVRQRAFEGGNDPNPVTEGNLDLYRMADEWGIEFLGEGRRRTDLIRLGFFTTEEWWDHQPSNSDHLKRFPVPTSAISGSNVLEQNPGY